MAEPITVADTAISQVMAQIENVRENPQNLMDDLADALETGGNPPEAEWRHRRRKATALEYIIGALCYEHKKLDAGGPTIQKVLAHIIADI